MLSAVALSQTSVLDIALQHAPVIAGRFDLRLHLHFANPLLATAVGYPVEQLLGSSLTHTHLAGVGNLATQHCGELLAGEAIVCDIEYQHATLGNRDAEVTLVPLRTTAGSVIDYLFFILDTTDASTDIARLKQLEQQARQLALYDPLTNLPNRRLLHERLDQSRVESARTGEYCALLSIDLDNFKSVNDLYGHPQGDLLLSNTARRLIQCVHLYDTVARTGGDEFVVILRNLGYGRSEALNRIKHIAAGMLTALSQPYQSEAGEDWGDHGLLSTPSIGAIPFTGTHLSNDELLQRSDMALYRAKANGRNQLALFEPSLLIEAQQRLTLEAELRCAIERQELRLHYQPQVDAQQRIVGMEALLRWQHPEFGLLLPGKFAALAEQNGLIVPIGQWVLDTACAQLAKWQQNPPSRHWTVSVNISSRQLHEPGFFKLLQACLIRSGINPSGLVLELTESVLLRNINQQLLDNLTQLEQRGVKLALDDFGTGYSSLSYLKRLPLNWLKIDRSFVRTLLDDTKDQAIVTAILALAATLNLRVVAEGVETREQFDYLRAAGCNVFQGYLFSRAAPAEQFIHAHSLNQLPC